MGSMSSPIIAIDLDDVISETNQDVADWHNETYGTSMTLDDFHYYHYWKNPYWGTPLETIEKVRKYYDGGIRNPKPVPGALDGAQRLKKLGFKLVIVTARHEEERPATEAWLNEHFHGVFDGLYCTGQFLQDKKNDKIKVKIGKAEVCQRVGALLLIDDSAENCLACGKAGIDVLLFGNYRWNKRFSSTDKPEDDLGYNDRLKYENGREWWKDERVDDILSGNVKRVSDWNDVIEQIKIMKAEGRL